jgi:4-aminobutyrate aminotransferase/(S)-3-amino-2-methylpropionate transaminase
MRPRLEAIVERFDVVVDARGKGAMLAIELNDPETGEPAPAIGKAIQQFALHQGVLFLTAGTFGNVLRFLPSVVITDEQLHEGLDVLEAALEEATGHAAAQA